MRHVALLAAFILVGSVVAGAPVATADQPTASTSSAAFAVGAPQTNFTIALRETGDARWTVETRIPLSDETDRAAFREYADAYEDGSASGGPSVDAFRNAASAAENATGREMRIERVNRTTDLHNESGVLRLRFTWTAFLRPGNDGALVLGDAFRTPANGTWFGSLSASQRLVIEPPENYEVSDVSQGFSYSISNRRIVAEGPQQLDADAIEVRYEPSSTPEPPTAGPSIELLVGGGVVAVFAVVLGVLAFRRGRSGSDTLPSPDDDDGTGVGSVVGTDDTAASANDTDGGTNGAESAGSGATGGGSESAAAGAMIDSSSDGSVGDDAADEPATEEDEPDLELLSDEERVERLLDKNGGRMRQANIVSGTGWSDAKVSQLLSAMADEGRIEKLRLGRENLISLAGHDPAGGNAGDGDDGEMNDSADTDGPTDDDR